MIKDHTKTNTNKLETFNLWQQSLQSRLYYIYLAEMWFYTLTKSDLEKTTPSENNGICIQYKFAKHIKLSFYNLYFCSNQFSLLVCHSANCVVGKTEPKRNLNIPASWRSDFPVLSISGSNICTLHSLCLRFKSFCPVVWIYRTVEFERCDKWVN